MNQTWAIAEPRLLPEEHRIIQVLSQTELLTDLFASSLANPTAGRGIVGHPH
jgi:hypothetical protein